MHGPYCYACGQPEKGMIRQLASVMADVLDTVFNIDSRVFRSLLPLYFRPGYLTLEYFAGPARALRDAVPPVLLPLHRRVLRDPVALNLSDAHFTFNLVGDNDDSDTSAQTEADVRASASPQALAGIDNGEERAEHAAGDDRDRCEKARAKIQKQADERLAYLQGARGSARQRREAAARSDEDDDGEIQFDGMPWDPTAHPIKVSWLPAFANAELNDMAGRAKENIDRGEEGSAPSDRSACSRGCRGRSVC